MSGVAHKHSGDGCFVGAVSVSEIRYGTAQRGRFLLPVHLASRIHCTCGFVLPFGASEEPLPV
jgi:hypothetical protein